MNPSAVGSSTANEVTSVCSCEASVRPGEKGTFTSCPAFFAASSTAAEPPRTIRSASETFFFPPDCEALNFFWIPSSVCSAFASAAGWFTSQSFCGARRMRAPFAPPRLSVPRNARRRRPCSRDQLRDRQSGFEDLGLQSSNVSLPDQFMIDWGNRVLP